MRGLLLPPLRGVFLPGMSPKSSSPWVRMMSRSGSGTLGEGHLTPGNTMSIPLRSYAPGLALTSLLGTGLPAIPSLARGIMIGF